jgi:hypothetical protein
VLAHAYDIVRPAAVGEARATDNAIHTALGGRPLSTEQPDTGLTVSATPRTSTAADGHGNEAWL